MPALRRSASPLDHLSEAARAFLARRTLESAGLALLGFAGAMTAALATWSVSDPSLNHATDAPVHNLLGYPGAIAADLAMQLFGLGSLALIAPPAVWGFRLMRQRAREQLLRRFALWTVGAGAATALASALPATARWPLPTGLGGVIGDALLRTARTVTGLSGGGGGAVLALVFAGVALLATTAACGFAFSDEADPDRALRRPGRAEPEDGEDGPRDDEPGWGIVSLGALAHLSMSLKSAVIRRIEAHRDVRPARAVPAAAGEQGDGGRPPRREPAFEPFAPVSAATAAPAKPTLDDEDDDAPPAALPQPAAAVPEDSPCTGPRARRGREPDRPGAGAAEARQAPVPGGAGAATRARHVPAPGARVPDRAQAVERRDRLGRCPRAERRPARRRCSTSSACAARS